MVTSVSRLHPFLRKVTGGLVSDAPFQYLHCESTARDPGQIGPPD